MQLGLPTGVDAPLGRRLAALAVVRLTVALALLVVIELFYFRRAPADGTSNALALATVGLLFLLTAVYAAGLRSGRSLRRLAALQLVTDQALWTVLVYLTGGATSGLTSLYGLTSVSGAIVLGPRGVWVSLTTGIACYLAMCTGFVQGWLPVPTDQAAEAYVVDVGPMLFPAVSAVMANALVGALAAYLAERLNIFGGRLEAVTKRAEENEQLAALGRLAAALAHEIRNPLGSIRGSVELLRTGPNLDEEDRRLCAIVERETTRLNDLVTDMLHLGRPRDPERRPIDLADLAQSVVELAEGAVAGRDLTIRYQGPPSLEIVADAAQMRQLLWNLVRNAIQASDAGHEIVITIEPPSPADVSPPRDVTLTVADEGSGIPSSKRDLIFEAFYTTRSHGVGIGLAVVKQVTDAHGFRLEVDTAEGSGTTFTVRIPRAVPAALSAVALLLAGCGGSSWVRDGGREEPVWWGDDDPTAERSKDDQASSSPSRAAATTPAPVDLVPRPRGALPRLDATSRVTGATGTPFRNTYYDFPEEPADADASVPHTTVFDAACEPIAEVVRTFHDQLCVQGSGRIASGATVSFAKRDCPCASVCPRTGQKICFEKLDPKAFPHGRGARGTAITPLRSVAVDPGVVPLGTALYIPAYHGLRRPDGTPHDGCFIAEDRGLKVVGRHVDIFTGAPKTTASWNQSVPSNTGVGVHLGAARCAYLAKQ
ncbi:MAG: ATP-binding protein [Myxococcota bacterium]